MWTAHPSILFQSCDARVTGANSRRSGAWAAHVRETCFDVCALQP